MYNLFRLMTCLSESPFIGERVNNEYLRRLSLPYSQIVGIRPEYSNKKYNEGGLDNFKDTGGKYFNFKKRIKE